MTRKKSRKKPPSNWMKDLPKTPFSKGLEIMRQQADLLQQIDWMNPNVSFSEAVKRVRKHTTAEGGMEK